MTKGSKNESNRLTQNIFLLNSIINDRNISDYGILVYCYLRAIQRADTNYYPISVELMDYYFRHTFDIDTRDKNKYVDGLNDLESKGLIHKINGKKFNFEYDLEPIYFNPAKTNKDNKMYFTVVYSNELQSIMQIDNKDFIGSKVKLLRYFINVVSTFLKGDHWSFKLNDGTLQDGIVGTSSMEILSDISNINKDTIATYNNILEKEELLYIYRAGAYKVIGNQMSGITNTYGRYEHKKYVLAEGEEHKEKYADDAKSIRHKTKKTTDRRSLGNKYRCLIKGIGKYDEDTIIDIYNYAVEYNRIHREDDYYIDKLKDLDFFKQYPFINNSNID